MAVEDLFQSVDPQVALRGIHLDLKGVPPTVDRLLGLLPVIAAARYNVILVEWEDAFPWSVDPDLRSPTAYSEDDVERFCRAAAGLGIELIPLVQCLGHMETPLTVERFKHLRVTPDDPTCLHALHPESRALVTDMVADVLRLMPDVKYFHLGGDEAGSLGADAETRAYIAAHGKGALYLQHVEPICDWLQDKAIRPILWHDMMVDWDEASLRSLGSKADLMVWGYGMHGNAEHPITNRSLVRHFAQHGIKQWGATAYKGADGHNIDRPNLSQREGNALLWAGIARDHDYVGVVATAWSRYTTVMVQCEPIDACLDALLAVGVILHDGEAAQGGMAAVTAALHELGEGERFAACKQAMDGLTRLRHRCWWEIQSRLEARHLYRMDPRRSAGRFAEGTAGFVRRETAAIAELEQQVWTAFAGLVADHWMVEYVATRLEPVKEALRALA